jgi:hypothetical protein
MERKLRVGFNTLINATHWKGIRAWSSNLGSVLNESRNVDELTVSLDEQVGRIFPAKFG